MKRYLLIIAVLLGAVCSRGQSKSDQITVLQKCFALPQVSQYYKLDRIGKPVSLYAVANDVTLPEGLDISYRGRKVTFGTQAQMDAIKADAYFSFISFNVEQDKASITFDYFYQDKTGRQIDRVAVKFNKTGGEWVISETKETRR